MVAVMTHCVARETGSMRGNWGCGAGLSSPMEPLNIKPIMIARLGTFSTEARDLHNHCPNQPEHKLRGPDRLGSCQLACCSIAEESLAAGNIHPSILT